MRIPDRQRNLLWSSVAISTLSSLCVLAISGIIGIIFKSTFLTISVPLWLLLGVVGVLLVLLHLLWTLRRSQNCKAKRVFLVIPAFDQKHYLAELIRNVYSVLAARGYALDLEIPHRDYSTVSQAHCLQRVLNHREDYIGGFVIPAIPHQAHQIQSDLVDFCNKVEIPVAFLDAEPFENEQHYPASTAFVGYSASAIGEAAAEWVAEYLFHKQIPCPGVLVISGDSQHLRQHRFKEHLNAKLDTVQIIDDTADFDRLRARDVTRKQLKQVKLKGQHLDVIFCTNDEMALGVVDALLFVDPSNARDTVVVGVDGTPQARALIEAGPGPLRATVIQDSYKVAEVAVDLLERILRKDQVPTRTFLPSGVLARD